MANEVKFPKELGGDDLVITDDANPDTGLANGGHRERFVPGLAGIVQMARTAVDAAVTATTKAAEALKHTALTAADRVATGADREAVAADRSVVAADKATVTSLKSQTQTAATTATNKASAAATSEANAKASEVAAGNSAKSASDDAAQVAEDKTAVNENRVQSDADAAATAADREAVAADRSKVAADKGTVAADKSTVGTYKTQAQASANTAITKASEASNSAAAAKASETAAAGSEAAADADAAATAADREAVAADRAQADSSATLATQKADQASSDATRAETARNGAEDLYGDLSAVKQARADAVDARAGALDSETKAKGYLDEFNGAYSAADILAKLLDVDTDDSGLNANTLQGKTLANIRDEIQKAVSDLVDSSPGALDTLNELAAALGDDPNFAATMNTNLSKKLDKASYTAADVLSKVLTVDGAGSKLDADTLDGLQGAQLARKDRDETFAGLVSAPSFASTISTITADQDLDVYPVGISTFSGTPSDGYPAYGGVITFNGGVYRSFQLQVEKNSGQLFTRGYDAASTVNDSKWSLWSTSWSNRNMGSGSGLDADTVDGVQASQLARKDKDEAFTKSVGVGTSVGAKAFNNGKAIAIGDDDSGLRGNGNGVIEFWADNVKIGQWTKEGIQLDSGTLLLPKNNYSGDLSNAAADFRNSDIIGLNGIYFADESNAKNEGLLFPRNNSDVGDAHYSSVRAYRDVLYFAPDASQDSYKVWHSGNHGAGSGLDADKLDGVQLSSLVRNDAGEQSIGGQLVVKAGGHADADNDYGVRIEAFEPAVAFQDNSTSSGNGLLKYNGKAFYLMIDPDASGTADITKVSSALISTLEYTRISKSLGVGGAIPGGSFDNGGAISLVDNDSGIRGVGDGQVEVWANNERQLVATKSTVRVDNQFIVSSVLTADTASGLKLVTGLEMANHDITGVNKICINDDGTSEGFMLPGWGFVADGSHGYILKLDANYNYSGEPHTRFHSNGELYTGYGIGGSGYKKVWHEGNDGSGSGLDADTVDGKHAGDFMQVGGSYGELRMGSGSDTNWDGIVYDEGANTLSFFADQSKTDTPRVCLGPGWVEAGGKRLAFAGDIDATKIANGGARLSISGSGNLDFYDGSSYRFRVLPNGRIDRADGGIDANLLNISVGAVGTYAFLKNNSSGSIEPGGKLSGSKLSYTSSWENDESRNPPGTWMLMGYTAWGTGNNANTRSSLWVRVS